MLLPDTSDSLEFILAAGLRKSSSLLLEISEVHQILFRTQKHFRLILKMESALAKILMRLIVIVFGRYEFFGTFGYPELSPQAIQLFSVLK